MVQRLAGRACNKGGRAGNDGGRGRVYYGVRLVLVGLECRRKLGLVEDEAT